MANDYFVLGAGLPRRQLATAEAVNAILAAVEAGFAKLPSLPSFSNIAPTVTVSGSANVLAFSIAGMPNPLPDGYIVTFIATATNTGPVTLNGNSRGDVPVRLPNAASLAAGDIRQGMVVRVAWTGSEWMLLTMPSGSLAQASADATAAANSASAASGSAAAASSSAAAALASQNAAAASAAAISPYNTAAYSDGTGKAFHDIPCPAGGSWRGFVVDFHSLASVGNAYFFVRPVIAGVEQTALSVIFSSEQANNSYASSSGTIDYHWLAYANAAAFKAFGRVVANYSPDNELTMTSIFGISAPIGGFSTSRILTHAAVSARPSHLRLRAALTLVGTPLNLTRVHYTASGLGP